jgi:hypothetical protein
MPELAAGDGIALVESGGTLTISVGVSNVSAINTAAANTTAIQNAINTAAAIGATLSFPPGVIQHNGLTWKNKVNARGAGLDTSGLKGTVLLYLGTGDGVQLNNPINSSTAANCSFEGITFKNANRNAGKACFADTGSTDLKFRLCAFIGSDRGLVFDQTELADVTECDFEAVASQTSLIWIVNGADRTGGALSNFTNRISVQRSQLNGGTGVIGIADDGGATHAFTDNNYNGCLKHLRAAGVLGLTLTGGEWESATGTSIILDSTSLAGAGVGPCSPVLFLAPIVVPTAGQHCVTIFSGGQLMFISPFFGNSTAVKCNGPANANSLFAIGINNGGGGANFDGYATNHWEVDHSNGLITNLQPALIEIAAASVTNAAAGAQKLFIDSADHKLKRKDSSGTVTIIA